MEENEVVEEGTQEVSNEAGGNEIPEIKDPKAVLEALERAKNDAKKFRETLEEKERAVEELTARIASLEGDEGIARWKKRAISLSAMAELQRQGIKDSDRILGLMDSDSLDLDDDGNLVGFGEALQAVKTKLPELFDKKRQVGGGADGFAKGEVKPAVNTTEMQLARLKAAH